MLADRGRRWPAEQVLREPTAVVGSASRSPRILAVVPARDESELLPRTLPSLLTQEGVDLCVLLVDDGSCDDTAETAGEVAHRAAPGAAFEVLTARRRAGWTGKLSALDEGVRHAQRTGTLETVDWLLLTDADICHRPGALRDLAHTGGAGGHDLVSVMARLHAASFWERLLVPPFVFFFQLLYPFRRVADPGSAVAAAAGGCVLLRPSLLQRIGGFARIRGEVIDDVALARAAKRVGARLWLGLDAGIVSLRAYPRLRDHRELIARTAFAQLRHRYDLLLVTLVGLAALLISPPIVVLASAVTVARASAPLGLATLLAALSAWTLEAAAVAPAMRHHRVPLRFAVGLPLAAFCYGAMTIISAWRHARGGGARWKGRSY